MKFIPAFIAVLAITLTACKPMPEKADKILHNGTIYTVDEAFSKMEAMAIKGDTVLATGSDSTILGNYEAPEIINLEGKPVYPGFIDAHCHFYWYGQWLQQVDLNDCGSYDKVLQKLKLESESTDTNDWLKGRGWDQNDWPSKTFPHKNKLDSLFPNRPVFLLRIDGHAALVNQQALTLAGIDGTTEVEGGKIEKRNGKPTGILLDNAIELVRQQMPEPDSAERQKSLQDAQEKCFKVGLTTVTDASMDHSWVEAIKAQHKAGHLQMRVCGMLNANEANLENHIQKGPFRTKKLHLNAIKLFSDGALGSRGAYLLEPYQDSPKDSGLLLHNQAFFEKWARIAYENDFQLNTHAIGDRACRLMLDVYSQYLKFGNDRRWRIEHAQIVHPDDLNRFGKYNIIPSVQPSHAISDMGWAQDRLGSERLQHAYAYKDLLQQNGFLVLGSDFPIETHDPLYQFYTGVTRKDKNGKPENGFLPSNAITRKQALKGLTRWAAFANFEEDAKGSLESGKLADFVILDKDIMKVPEDQIMETEVLSTYLGGKMVYASGESR